MNYGEFNSYQEYVETMNLNCLNLFNAVKRLTICKVELTEDCTRKKSILLDYPLIRSFGSTLSVSTVFKTVTIDNIPKAATHIVDLQVLPDMIPYIILISVVNDKTYVYTDNIWCRTNNTLTLIPIRY